MEEILLTKSLSHLYDEGGKTMILATAMKIMKMGVKRTVVGSMTTRFPQDGAVQSDLLFAQQIEVVLALIIALPLLAIGVVKERTQGKEEGDPLLHLLLHQSLQAMMQVHKKLVSLHLPKRGRGHRHVHPA